MPLFGERGDKAACRLSQGTSFLLVISPVCTVQQPRSHVRRGAHFVSVTQSPPAIASVDTVGSAQSMSSWQCLCHISVTSVYCHIVTM